MHATPFLLDTNILILLFNGRLAEPLPDGSLGCSLITEMELLSFPALTSEEEASIREKLAELAVYDIDPATQEAAIRLRRSMRLKLPDAIVAATAVVHGAILVTNDMALHAIPGLTCRALAVNE